MWEELDYHHWPPIEHGQLVTVKTEEGLERQAVFCCSIDEWWVVDQDTKKELRPTHYLKAH